MAVAHNLIEHLEFRRLLSTVPSGFLDQSVGGTISSGTAMDFAPDGRLFVTTQTGQVRVIDQSGNLLATPAISLSVDSFFERGLLGIAFDPTFDTGAPGDDYVYLYYTLPAAQGGPINQISRFTVTGDTIDAGSRAEIFRFNALSAGNHNGGAIHFGPDNMLYAAHGDNAVSANSQGVTNLLGKIIRINPAAYNPADPEAVIPSDNPTSFRVRPTTSTAYTTVVPTGINRAIWAVGLRNPFTTAFNPADGTFFINDVGQSSREEVNRGVAGANYGWPRTEGDFDPAAAGNEEFTRPIYNYARGSFPGGASVAGGAFYVSDAPTQFPAQFQGRYFLGEYVSDWIAHIDPNVTTPLNAATLFASGASGVVDLKVGPDGALYYLQRDGTAGVRRVRPDPTQVPSILDQPDNQSVFDGDNATFEVLAGGVGTLTYQWTRNGVDIPGANSATYVFENAQFFDNGAVFRCKVSNNIGLALSDPATLTVIVNGAPIPDISQPLPGTLYTAGDTVNFAGTAFDPEDGALPVAALTWQVDFHHDDHVHPFMAPTPGVGSGMFTIPQIGETAADVFYRIYLRAVDSLGRVGEAFVDVLPRTADITIATNVPGLSIGLDGQPVTTPHNFTGVAGIIRNLDAPVSQVVLGQTYEFQSWSDGGAANHDITTPLVNTTYTATYNDVTAPLVADTIFAFSSPAPAPPHRLQVVFSENVGPSLAVTDITVTNLDTNTPISPGAIGLNYDTATNTANFSFPGLPGGVLADGNYRLTMPAGSVQDGFGNLLASPLSFDFFAFQGDADHNRTIDIGDFAALGANFNETGTTFAEGDFNYSGVTDIDDFSILASRFNQTLAAARPAAAVSAASESRSIFANSPIPTVWKGIEEDVGPLPA